MLFQHIYLNPLESVDQRWQKCLNFAQCNPTLSSSAIISQSIKYNQRKYLPGFNIQLQILIYANPIHFPPRNTISWSRKESLQVSPGIGAWGGELKPGLFPQQLPGVVCPLNSLCAVLQVPTTKQHQILRGNFSPPELLTWPCAGTGMVVVVLMAVGRKPVCFPVVSS